MCGISAFFARESIPDFSVIDKLFSDMQKRGSDGFGCTWIRNINGKRTIDLTYRNVKNYSDPECKKKIKDEIYPQLKIGDILIGIQRASPETESATDVNRIEKTLQPVVNKNHGLVIVHNGAVSRRIDDELRSWSIKTREYKFKTDIDSEAILCSIVKYQRNLKNAFEYLSGGFAVIGFDEQKDSLFVANDHMQIAHGYIRGIGFFLHSDCDTIGKIIQDVTGMNRDGVFIWESHYHHFLDGHAIREIDLQSGFMKKIKYNPRYIVGDTFDSSKKE